MVNKPLIRPYFWGGYVRGGTLTSHDLRLPGAHCPAKLFRWDDLWLVGSGDEAEGSWCQSCTLEGSPNIAGWKMGAPD